MDVMQKLAEKAASCNATIVFPEGTEHAIIAAARQVADRELGRPILLGAEPAIIEAAEGISLDGIEIVEVGGGRLETFVASYAAEMDFPEAVAQSFLTQPLFFGAFMVREGEADCMVAGLANATEDVIMASEMMIGMAEGVGAPSSFFLMDIPTWQGSEGSLLIFADCAVNPNPTPAELADIAITTAGNAKRMFDFDPRVALLSFSSKGSADHPDVRKVQDALAIVRERDVPFSIDGEFQADTAIVEAVAAKKLKEPGDVAGRANVLVFPDLDAGNIAYKLAQRLTGGAAYGPVIQGFAKPVSDLSRGATVDDIVGAAIMAAAGVSA